MDEVMEITKTALTDAGYEVSPSGDSHAIVVSKPPPAPDNAKTTIKFATSAK